MRRTLWIPPQPWRAVEAEALRLTALRGHYVSKADVVREALEVALPLAAEAPVAPAAPTTTTTTN